jgi:drug/metabolite transporter (DMT)-like permease
VRRAKPRLFLPTFAAPILFGAGTALSKPFLTEVHPAMMAGFLYASAGIGLSAWRIISPSEETSLRRDDLSRLAAVIFFGGMLGPVLLMFGLARIPTSNASLLLNSEAPLTSLLAAALFHEHVGGFTALAVLLITAGGIALAGFKPIGASASWVCGSAAVAAAALCWAIENNLVQALSERDPVQVAASKCTVAGAVNVVMALALGASLPSVRTLGEIACIGLVSYGASLACYLASIRRIGAAKTSMHFALAPFFGAAIAVAVLGESVTAALAAAAALMGFGIWLSAREEHVHEHTHEQEHEHLHAHDEHHRHHAGRIEGPHSHRHSHIGLRHTHPHDPDIHHRHE